MRDDELTGKTIGGYRIVRELGHGGMGVVYAAIEESLDRPVALKVLAHRLCEDPTFVKRFLLEARAAARLSHPNIVPVFSVGESDGLHYYAMEMVKGVTFADYIKERPVALPLPGSA